MARHGKISRQPITTELRGYSLPCGYNLRAVHYQEVSVVQTGKEGSKLWLNVKLKKQQKQKNMILNNNNNKAWFSQPSFCVIGYWKAAVVISACIGPLLEASFL